MQTNIFVLALLNSSKAVQTNKMQQKNKNFENMKPVQCSLNQRNSFFEDFQSTILVNLFGEFRVKCFLGVNFVVTVPFIELCKNLYKS